MFSLQLHTGLHGNGIGFFQVAVYDQDIHSDIKKEDDRKTILFRYIVNNDYSTTSF